ncbi:MAG: heme exporter protein CcmB [Chloroflexota bacterium]
MKRTTPFLRAVLTIAGKDLRAELRSRQLISAIGLFALLATMVFYYTLESRPDVRVAALPAVLWVIIVFAGTLGLNRSLAQEFDRGSLDGLLLAPIDRSALFFGKLISTWLFSVAVAGLVSLAVSILFNVGLNLPAWTLVIVLGTLGFSAVGTFLGSMAIYARGRETTLPILILPVALPIIAAAVSASNAILADLPFADWSIWLMVLASVDAIFLVLALLLFDFVVEE